MKERRNDKVDWSGREYYYDNEGNMHFKEPMLDIVEDLLNKGMSYEELGVNMEVHY